MMAFRSYHLLARSLQVNEVIHNNQCVYFLFRNYCDDRKIEKIKSYFDDGLFVIRRDKQEFVLSYYTPLKRLLKCLIKSDDERDDAAIFSGKTKANKLKSNTILGAAFQKSESVRFELENGRNLVVYMDSPKNKLAQWASSQNIAVESSLSVKELEKQKTLLMQSYTPLVQDFEKILAECRGSSSRKFKWLGLFLVSVPLGFVGRLTWFEYSWDIMEPFTWCITYAWGIIAFGYYVMTSQEYQYPQVERRMAIKHFCDSYGKKNFDLTSFTTLHQQIKQLNDQIIKLKAKELEKNQSSPSSSE